MSYFTGIRAQDIPIYRDILIPLIEKPLKRTGVDKYITPEHVLDKCFKREWQCWVVHDGENIEAALFTYINVHPTGYKSFTIDLVGGSNLNDWFTTAWLVFKEYAKANGCSEIIGAGRKGWLRMIEDEKTELMRFSVELKDE